jgi:hypothetical protein
MPTTAELLAFEARWGVHSSNKEEAIHSELRMAPARYYQLLHRVVRSIEGIRMDPQTCSAVRARLANSRTRSTTLVPRPVR